MEDKSRYTKLKGKIRKLEKELLGFNQRSNWRNRFFDLSIDLLCVIRSDGCFRQINPAWIRTFGWTSRQLVDQPLIDFIHPDDKIKVHSALEKFKQGDTVFSLECRFKGVQGQWIRLSWNAYPVPEENITFAVVRNISESHNTSEKSRAIEERYQRYIEQSSEGIWHMAFKDPISVGLPMEQQVRLIYSTGYVSECNDVFARMYGYEKSDDMQGKNLPDLYGSNDSNENYEANLHFVKNKYRLENIETTETTKSGGKKYFVNNAIGFIKNDHLVGIWGTQRDVTDQKLAEERLRVSETSYREIFNSYAEGIFVHNAENGEVIDVNRTILQMYGFRNSEEAIHHFNNLYKSDHQSFTADQAKKLIQKSVAEGPQIFEWLAVKKNGQRFWLEVILKSVQLAGVKRVLSMVKDIDDRKYAQDALKENELRYRNLFESSSDAIFIVNHNTIVDCNNKSLQLFTASRGMVIGQDIIKFLSTDSGKIKLEDRLQLARKGEERLFEWPCRDHNDKHFDAEIKTSSIDLGNTRHLQIIIRDLSETKKAQESARSSEEKFSGIFRVSPNAIAISSLADDKILDINNAFEKMSGFSREELIGKTWKKLHLFRSQSQYEKLLNDFSEKGELVNCELDYVDRKKRVITALLSLKAIEVDGEKCLMSIAHDITNRKSIEKELQYRSQFEKFVSEISARFINLSLTEIDIHIEQTLNDICQFTNTNMGYVFRITDDWTKREMTHLWTEKNTTINKTKYAVQDIKLMPLWMGKIADQKVVAISSPKEQVDLSPEEKGFINYFGLKAVIDIPMIYQDRVFGILGLGSLEEKNLWTENEIALLKMIGQVFTNALHRKEAEKTLRESEERFRSIIQHMSDIVWIIDIEGRVMFETPSSARILGYEPGALTGEVGFNLLHPDDLKLASQEFQEVLEKKNDMIPSEFRFKHQDGHWVVMELVATNMLHHEGIKGILISARDISAKRETESALVESEQKYRNIFQNIQDVYFEITPGGIILEISPAISDFTGHNRVELIGQSFSTLFKDPAESELFLNTMEQLESLSDFEVCLFSEKNKNRLCSVNAEILKDDSGVPEKTFGTIRDVTERKRLQDQLNQSQKMESIGTLAGGIAHDFNNLLTVIMGHAELISLNMDKLNPFYRDIISILNAGRKAEKLTRQLLTFSRKQLFEPKVININKVISNLEKMTRRLIGEDISIESKLHFDIPNIKADPGQIEQVLINLLVNARDAIQDEKFVPSDKFIILETGKIFLDMEMVSSHPGAREGWHVFFAVSDSGCGMDNETKDKIFEPFFTTKEQGKGTGLGLSTVYGIVKQNQGSIYVYSELGKGTTIKIYWPVSDESMEDTEVEPEQGDRFSGSESILLVEDDTAVRSFACTALCSLGYTVYEAADGLEAIGLIKENNKQIDLVLTDVVMPGMDGKELSERLSEILPEAKIVFTSGYTDNHIVEKGVLSQDLNFLSKPYSTQSLATKIRNVLNS